ncbi:short chain dehydrogenase reductase family protein, putative [Ichthyophthirius multifiliis]|uniref:Short chain dehydrogenase reductase family protein, putative n=1 Tax=Ichthyophthirius multifiliis TaxID=5932 RepID=G0QR34_ICHMU|nr:short chain dehydrogenase reductase family protein, putative [Ichthyophthirius multifiliis]EGR32319.1 short chain dehydrogenase reductase family protein, putative [Ichthyophthirius multifiliis]|eukprot:XP_004035805.1 short chain dehydrogenase reductase family protein, putative [Ichthyophthirius multifiliis]
MGFWINVLMVISGSILLYFIKQYFNGGVCTIRKEISNKVVIITGASSGIGLETARYLAAMGATIIFACRNRDKTLYLIDEIKKETNNEKLEYIPLDLTSIEQINYFCLLFKKRFNQLDILINNAGIMCSKYMQSQDGLELTYSVNFLGHFTLTYQLLDLIRKNSRCRIINVSSVAHSKCDELDISRINDIDYFDSFQAYWRSKLAIILFTKELQRKLEGLGPKCVCVHPGLSRTDLVDELLSEKLWLKIVMYLLYPLYWLVTKDSWQGAQTAIYCALEKHDKLMSGGYYVDCELSKSSQLSENKLLAQELWDDSAVVLGYI